MIKSHHPKIGDLSLQENRSKMMARIHSFDTRPELIVRRYLFSLGFRYRINYNLLPGKPDIVFLKKKKVIFVNGCFWHGHNCKYFKYPKTNTEYWNNKINTNRARDKIVYDKLANLGYNILVIWECDLHTLEEVKTKVISFLND